MWYYYYVIIIIVINRIRSIIGSGNSNDIIIMSINFKNNPLKFGNTGNSISLGIGMVHQHFTLADNLTVLENIIIGHKSLFSVSLSKKRSLDKLNSLINRFN